MITFKIATESDIEMIIDLAIKSWFPTYKNINSKEQNEYMFSIWYSPEGLLKQMNEGQTFILILDGDKYIGYASYTMIVEHEFKLNKIYVLPESKGKGFGKKLLNEIENIVKSKNCLKLFLNVNRGNNAVEFYKSQGYQIIREENIPFDNFWMNDYLMCKQF